jgi:choline-glycine betaine transporter
MYLIAIAWGYVVLMMALVEAMSPQGTVLGALFTLLLYGALPLSIVLYLMATPHRRRARREAEAAELAARTDSPPETPDRGGHAAGNVVPPVGKEP